MLETVDSIAELETAKTDPAGFFKRVAAAGGPGAKKWAAINARPRIESHLNDQGLVWSDVQPVLEELDSIAEIEAAAADPNTFFASIATKASPAAKKWAVVNLKPRMESYLATQGTVESRANASIALTCGMLYLMGGCM